LKEGEKRYERWRERERVRETERGEESERDRDGAREKERERERDRNRKRERESGERERERDRKNKFAPKPTPAPHSLLSFVLYSSHYGLSSASPVLQALVCNVGYPIRIYIYMCIYIIGIYIPIYYIYMKQTNEAKSLLLCNKH